MKLRLIAGLFVFAALAAMTLQPSANAAGDLNLAATGCRC